MESLLVQKMLEKAQEAFMMAIEIYNRPTIKYRVEGFSLFICNAWELMLKAHLIKIHGDDSIYYKDTKRTLSLEKCLEKVITNEKAPIRKNLLKILELRNTSTHFIVEEYEMVYIPLFQACVFNFVEKIKEYHGIDITKLISQNFLNLVVTIKQLDENSVRAKYTHKISDKLIKTHNNLLNMIDENNEKFAIKIEHYHYQTKDQNKANSTYRIARDGEIPIQVIKDLKDPNDTHKFTMKSLLENINNRLENDNVVLKLANTGNNDIQKPQKFNSYYFKLFDAKFNLKGQKKYCYCHSIGKQKAFTYSMQAIDFIVGVLESDPENILEKLRLEAKNKITPGAWEFLVLPCSHSGTQPFSFTSYLIKYD